MAKDKNKAAEANVTSRVDDDGYQTLPGGFPPFIVLDVDDVIKFEVQDVTTRETVKKVKNKSVSKTEIYFRVALEAEAEARERTTKGPRRTFGAGEIVTLNISGTLENRFGRLALEREGKDPNDKELSANLSVLKGEHFRVKRLKDGVMGKNSAFPGNPVKDFDIGVKQAVAA